MKTKPIKIRKKRERVIRLSSDDAAFLVNLLEKPPPPNARLRKALQTYKRRAINVYTLQQAARRSWRIGQKQPVNVYFLGYAGSAQMQCLELMAKKIAVSQSTSGDMPDSGLDVLNQGGDSIEVALAKRLVG